MNYEPIQNNAHEPELLSDDERRLSALLGGLKRVEAPKDFDFKLKARIAAAAPVAERKPFFLPALRYVLPLCLVVMLSAFAALRIFAPGDEPVAAPIAESSQTPDKNEIASANVQQQFIPAQEATANFVSNESAPITATAPKTPVNGKKTIALVKLPTKTVEKNEVKSKNNFGGDYERTAKASRVINENPNAPGIKNPNAGQSAKISVRDLLKEIGIEVEFVGADCKVTAVREGTAARIANFQPGDLIETIDDKKPSSETTFLQSFTGKVFRVLRGGKQVVIDLTKK